MAASFEESLPGNKDTQYLARRVGLVTAILSSLFGALYLFGLGVNLATSGTTHSSSEAVQLFSAVIGLLWDIDLVILFMALRGQVQEKRKLWIDLAFVFMVLLCATSGINWFVQLIIMPGVIRARDTALMALIDPYNPLSIMFAVEHLGWGVFFGFGTLFGAFAFAGNRLENWLRGLLLIGSLLSFLHVIGLAISSPFLSFLGYVAWGLALPAATFLMSMRFRQK
jgi:hypothetical protein